MRTDESRRWSWKSGRRSVEICVRSLVSVSLEDEGNMGKGRLLA